MSLVSSSTTNKRLQGKVAIITGGARGIGASAARIFHQNGAKVIIADIQDAEGQTLADALGEGASYMHCDVSVEDDVSSLIDAVMAKHGRLDVMYNNAGVLDRSTGGILDATRADFERVMSINVMGAFLGAKHASRVMMPQGNGCILFTASACTCIAGLGPHLYAASKHAVWGLAKNLAGEVGRHGIRVNCVSPYGVATRMVTDFMPDQGDNNNVEQIEHRLSLMGNLKGHVLKADDVANAALFLASDEAHYVSGVNLIVDGGFSGVNPSFFMNSNHIDQ